MLVIVALLGVYSASMYKMASNQTPDMRIVDMPISNSSQADVERILNVVKPRVHGQGSTTYFPGVACVIDAGPDTTTEMMEEFFVSCLSDHTSFMDGESFSK